MEKLMKHIVDNASGPTGAIGIAIGHIPENPSDLLIFFSTVLVLCQIVHWLYRFFKWWRKKE